MIGERLAEIRKDHGDKQTDLAEKLNATLSTIRKWEQEKSSPSHEMLVSICKLYGVSSDFLLGLSGDDPVYRQRRQKELLSNADRATLREFENFLIWKQKKTPNHL